MQEESLVGLIGFFIAILVVYVYDAMGCGHSYVVVVAEKFRFCSKTKNSDSDYCSYLSYGCLVVDIFPADGHAADMHDHYYY
jgi:hypothetical protein